MIEMAMTVVAAIHEWLFQEAGVVALTELLAGPGVVHSGLRGLCLRAGTREPETGRSSGRLIPPSSSRARTS